MAHNSAMSDPKTQARPRFNILLKAARGHQVVDVRSIALVEAADRYCRAVLTDGSHRQLFHTLTDMERILCAGERIGDLLFLRMHRSFIVAFHHATGMEGKERIKLVGELHAPVSRQMRVAMLSAAGTVQASR